MSISERKKELKRRRHRRHKYKIFKRKLATATVSERAVIAEKIRNMTPGCWKVLENLGLEQR